MQRATYPFFETKHPKIEPVFAEFDIKIESKRGNRHIKQDAFEETNDFNDNSYIETIIIVNAISICCHITLFSRYARAVLEQNLNIAAIQF